MKRENNLVSLLSSKVSEDYLVAALENKQLDEQLGYVASWTDKMVTAVAIFSPSNIWEIPAEMISNAHIEILLKNHFCQPPASAKKLKAAPSL